MFIRDRGHQCGSTIVDCYSLRITYVDHSGLLCGDQMFLYTVWSPSTSCCGPAGDPQLTSSTGDPQLTSSTGDPQLTSSYRCSRTNCHNQKSYCYFITVCPSSPSKFHNAFFLQCIPHMFLYFIFIFIEVGPSSLSKHHIAIFLQCTHRLFLNIILLISYSVPIVSF